MKPHAATFHRSFERWARRVRARLMLRDVVTGATWGLVVGAAAAGAAWWLRAGELRPWMALLGLAGGLAGAVVAARRRWSDTDVALYLDARLASDEALSTAVELWTEAEREDAARRIVVERAATTLEKGDPKLARPRVLGRVHALVPLAGAGIAAISLAALPPPPPEPPPAPGAEIVEAENLKGLEKVEALGDLTPRDPDQQKRLREIAEQARRLKEQLVKGMEKREALAEIAKLRDAVTAEKLNLGDKKNRRGLEAAIGALNKRDATKRAAEALGDGDLVEFDEEMKKLASQAEEEDREAAKKALEEAEERAREQGAEDLAEALKEQRELFERREARAEALRELARALGDRLGEQGQEALRDFGESGSPEARRRLAEAMNDALEGLTDEERKRVAERLGDAMEQGGAGGRPMTKEELEELAERMASPEGKRELAERVRELAEEDPSDGSRRRQGLGDAERGLGDAQRGLGAIPVPSPGSGQGQQPGSGNQSGQSPGGDTNDGQGGPGGDRDEGTGSHEGTSEKVTGGELRAKANPKLDKSVPMLGATRGRTTARPGETANQRGVGALGEAAPEAVGGAERSEVPEEYREHVGRYFSP